MKICAPKLVQYTAEYGMVEYLMRVYFNAPLFTAQDVYDIRNQEQMKKFNRFLQKYPESDVIDVFIPIQTINQPVSDIVRIGLRFNSKLGFRFYSNGEDFPKDAESYEVVHLVIALGYVRNFFDDSSPNIDDLDGFNTLKLDNNEFMIFSNEQVFSSHIIRFKGGENLSSQCPENIICNSCKSNRASCWCENDSLFFCASCDKSFHLNNPLTSSHERIPLSDAIPMIQMCPFHQNIKASYYCYDCKHPICIDCKVHGNHSSEDTSKHHLVPLQVAYSEALFRLKESNKAEKDKDIQDLMKNNEELLKSIKQSSLEAEKKIMELAKKAIEDLKEKTRIQELYVRSSQMELERKMDLNQKREGLVQMHAKSSSALSFLQTFEMNEELKIETNNRILSHNLPSVFESFQVIGSIKVSTRIHQPDQQAEYSENADYTYDSQTVDNTEEDENNTTPVTFVELSKIASKKQQKYLKNGVLVQFSPFEGSSIIINVDHAITLYHSLPFKGTPLPRILFSTNKNGRSLKVLHEKIDDVGITAILVKVKQHIFGGFAATKWNSKGVPFGEQSNSFLFSISKNAYLPFEPHFEDSFKLLGSQKAISFGKTDLVLSSDFDKCISIIGHSYGSDNLYDTEVSRTFLAGTPTFKADVVEVWGFYSNK